jgi:hypothetical protein
MLRSLRELKGYRLAANEGEIGRVRDLLFDDERWMVRYVVAATGPWLFGREFLLRLASLGRPDLANRQIDVNLTREQVKNAPGLETDAPVSRQQERELLKYFGWTPFWRPTPPGPLGPDESGDTHLRSVEAVTGYTVGATDGDFGEVADFITDDNLWTIRYVAVETSQWLPGRQVLLTPGWFLNIDWTTHRAELRLKRDELEQAPEYRPEAAFSSRDEAGP